MAKMKLFLYDFVTKKKIRKYIIAIILFAAVAYYWRQSNPDWTLGAAAMSNVGLSIAFLTTLYSIFSYATMDKIKAYLMLPCKKTEVFFSFFFAQYFSLLLERMSFVIVAAAFFADEPALTIMCLLLSALSTVVLDVVFMMSVNRKKHIIALLPLILIAAMYGLLTCSKNAVLNFSVLAALVFAGFFGMTSMFDPKHLSINRESKAAGSSIRRVNYFLTVLTREKIVLINTASIFVFAAVFAFISKATPFLLNVIWGIAAMNTPATTMLSGDKALMRQEKMLPRHSQLMSGVYASFLSVYFAAVNAYVLLLFAILGRFSFLLVLAGAALTGIETGVSLYLERKFPIREWQKKQEVWRNPRKYILPILVCIVAVAPYLLGFL